MKIQIFDIFKDEKFNINFQFLAQKVLVKIIKIEFFWTKIRILEQFVFANIFHLQQIKKKIERRVLLFVSKPSKLLFSKRLEL